MHAVILAAGYATRLGPVTLNRAKPLLDIAGAPLLTHLARASARVEGLQSVHLITNAKFFDDFTRWRDQFEGASPVDLINDGTRSNHDRLGAIGDLCLAVDRLSLDDDLLIIGGDNLFQFDLNAFVAFGRERGTSVAVYTLPDRALASRYGNVELDASGRIAWFEEKPAQPRTALIATCVYFLRREHVPKLGEYRAGVSQMDAPGLFFRWLAQQTEVFGYAFEGLWFDIGDEQSLAAARAAFATK